MGKLTIATDIGGVFREVTNFPAGTANDGGITGVVINGKKAVRQRKGVHYCEEVGIFADGGDYTARLNAVFANVKLKTLRIHVDGGGTIVINGTVNVPDGKIIEFYDGTMFGGTGTITGFKIKADDTTQCVATGSTLTFTPARFSGPHICPVWWGFLPGTGADMSPALQKAVTLACQNPFCKVVFIGIGGFYKVKNIYVMKNPGQANAGQTTCSILGHANSSDQSVVFSTTDTQAAILHFQQVLGCNVERITFDGPIMNYVTNPVLGDFAAGGQRTNGVTPSCAANIDGIWTHPESTITADNRYPGLPSSLYNNTHYGGSTNIHFIDCNFFNFYVGVANGLSGCPNGEGIRVSGGNSHNIGYLWVAGQLQSRENVIDNHYLYNCIAPISNLGWGNGYGDLPAVVNCNWNQCKYLYLNGGPDFGFVRFSGLYAEGVWSMGISLSQATVAFNECQVTQLSEELYGGITPPAPVFNQTGGPFKWQGGKLEMVGNYSAPIAMNCFSAAFRDLFVRGGHIFQTDPRFVDKIRFDNVSFATAGSGGVLLSDIYSNDVQQDSGADMAYFNGRYFLPGNYIYGRDHRKLLGNGRKIERLEVGQFAVTVNAGTATCTFTPDNVGKFLVSDTLHVDESVDFPAGDIFADTSPSLGYVSSLAGGVVTCKYVPKGVPSGVYKIYIIRYPRFAGRGIGSITTGQNTITNFIYDNAQMVTVGNRIKGKGIPYGTYVTGWNAGTKILTMSMNATAINSRVEICDAQYQALADNNPFIFFGGQVTIFDIALIWFAGDEVLNFNPHAKDTSRNYRSMYCLRAGKMADVTFAPYFFTEKTSMDTHEFDGSHHILLNNVYYDTAAAVFRYKITDPVGASALQFEQGNINFYTFVGGTSEAIATLVRRFQINLDGSINTYDNSITGATEPTNENSKKLSSTQWVRIYTNATYARLAGAYQTITAQTQINALVVGQLKGTGASPTVLPGTGAGTGGTASISLGHSFSFRLTINTGSAPAGSTSVIATITLAEAVGGDNPLIAYAARNAQASTIPFYFETNSHQEVVVKAGATLPAAGSFVLDITVIDY